jgi:hypothetical protein
MKRHLLVFFGIILFSFCNAQEIFRMPVNTQSRVSSFENLNGIKGAGGKTNKTAKGNAFESIKAGESKTLLEVTGAGIIQRMWITFSDRSPEMLRSLHLKIFWDDALQPAVDVPLGDFFCAGLGRPIAFQSALFSNPEGRSFNCYIPMPFKKAAKVVVINESKKDLALFFYDVDFVQVQQQPEDMLYFHAYWNRQQTSEVGKDFELLPHVTGKGRFLGVNVGVHADSLYKDTWYGEGEVKMYIDGDNDYPTINGTGTEDYIGTGWGEGAFTNTYQGCTIADEKNGLFTFYRFHIPDAIYFYKDFKAIIQQIGGGSTELVRSLQQKGVLLKPVSVSTDTAFIRLFEKQSPMNLQDENLPKGWVNFYRIYDYSATIYFYLDKQTHNLPSLVSVNERIKQ